MTNADLGPQAAPLDRSPRASFWIRELPYILVFILTILGVAYTSYTKKPILGYWELLAPVIALVCIGAGWRRAPDRSARLRLIWTQALHWFAFLLVMTLMLLSEVQRILSAGATGLAILTLLALGTFTAGVHVMSWQALPAGARHGARRSRDRMGRAIGVDRDVDRFGGGRNWRRRLVALARESPSRQRLTVPHRHPCRSRCLRLPVQRAR